MSPLVAQRPLPPALDALVCSLIGGARNCTVRHEDLVLIINQMHQAAWYARCTGGPEAAIAELDLAVATERLAHVLTPQTPQVLA